MRVEFKDHSEDVLAAFQKAVVAALTECGMVAGGHAKKTITENKNIDTGLLRNSITYALSGEQPAISNYKADTPKPNRENAGNYSGTAPESSGGMSVYIGTNVEYGPYVELATGKHNPSGRPTSWTYKDSNGNWHKTGGNPARPFLKPAVADHKEQYLKIINKHMRRGK